jgi:hypothetical protein
VQVEQEAERSVELGHDPAGDVARAIEVTHDGGVQHRAPRGARRRRQPAVLQRQDRIQQLQPAARPIFGPLHGRAVPEAQEIREFPGDIGWCHF